MWIKSQDKKTLVNADDLFVVDLSVAANEEAETEAIVDFSVVTATNAISTNKYTVLGSYTSEARAIAVIVEIEKVISKSYKEDQTNSGVTYHKEVVYNMPAQ